MSQSKRTSRVVRRYHHGDLRNSLIKAARSLLAETDNPDFSLREVAARAGVSHNAPYNHFADKNELLAAIAIAGFEELRDSMRSAIKGVDDPESALIRSGVAYVMFGIRNRAHYRLMFSARVTEMRRADKDSPVSRAAIDSRNVVLEIIHRGAEAGVFAVSPHSDKELGIAGLAAWSTAHGLTTLTIDGASRLWHDIDENLAAQVATAAMYGLLRREPQSADIHRTG